MVPTMTMNRPGANLEATMTKMMMSRRVEQMTMKKKTKTKTKRMKMTKMFIR
jgi:hypothetical protein